MELSCSRWRHRRRLKTNKTKKKWTTEVLLLYETRTKRVKKMMEEEEVTSQVYTLCCTATWDFIFFLLWMRNTVYPLNPKTDFIQSDFFFLFHAHTQTHRCSCVWLRVCSWLCSVQPGTSDHRGLQMDFPYSHGNLWLSTFRRFDFWSLKQTFRVFSLSASRGTAIVLFWCLEQSMHM